MNYETATNFELNIKLATLMAWRYEKGITDIQYDEQQNCLWIENGRFQSFPIVDYCNNWNDNMPIAVELGVGYLPMAGGDYHTYEICHKNQVERCIDISDAEGLKRALVIGCIKVLERE